MIIWKVFETHYFFFIFDVGKEKPRQSAILPATGREK
jgi:hypothetical protein